jgi:GxxExxY protein
MAKIDASAGSLGCYLRKSGVPHTRGLWHPSCRPIGMPHLTAEQLDRITDIVIGAAIRVHRTLGPGLLESVYLACLAFELAERGVSIETQRPIPVEYRGVRLECGFRADLIVEGAVIVEVKSLERLTPVHDAQMITYLRLSRCVVGLILNFNTRVMKDGIKRMVNNFPGPSPSDVDRVENRDEIRRG